MSNSVGHPPMAFLSLGRGLNVCFWLVVYVLTLTLGASRGFAATASAEDLEAALDDVLLEVTADYEQRLALVAQVDDFLRRGNQANSSLWAKNRLAEAMANLRLSRFDLSRQQVDNLCGRLTAKEFPALRFRCLSLQAALMMLHGDPVGSLERYERLLAEDLSRIPADLVSRAQINYAGVLNENGRSAEAADIYERLMVVALSKPDDALALYAGNNLVVILIAQNDHLAAGETLEQLEAIIARNPDSIVLGSLRLHQLELMRVGGELPAAISGLRAFIDQKLDTTPLMLGSAHKLLADALREAGDLEEALEHVTLAAGLLDSHANESVEARLSQARVLMSMGSYDQVLALLADLDIGSEAVPSRRVLGYRLELEALLRQSGRDSEVATLLALNAADADRDQLASTTRSEYFEARLTAARRGLELQQAEAQAEAALEKHRIGERNRNLSFILIGLVTLAVCMIVFSTVKRQAERRLLREKVKQNQELEAIVENKTRELTANLRSQADMARALERKKRAEAIGLLAGNVAHDFNNLLQVIASGNETLAKSGATAEEKASVLEVSNSSLKHASRIIRQLLAYSRQQDLAASEIRFGEYLKNSQALLHSAAGEQHELVVEDSSSEAAVLVDPAQLTTSLLNLISNATDAMPAGGLVTVSSQVRQLDEEGAREWNDISAGEFLVLGVRDTGVGMTEGQVARASEPFFTTKNLQSGTGLGLSSVYGFVKQSGGDLKIHSVPGEGTLVQILLPLIHERHESFSSSIPERSVVLEGKRMLLVEDNESVAAMLEAVLRSLKLDTTRVASGTLAQELLRKDSTFDFVLSDVRMPGALDGPGLARWIKHEVPEVQVFLMSGFSELGPEHADLPLLHKPFNIDQLQRFLANNSATVNTAGATT